ncbi:MAG: hypothetical protein QOJ15_10960, partial [Bradyrhizobium sp.]|nr:hypothetical protein [Bradyrhizobium sp.]
ALPGALNGHVRQFLWRIWPALVVVAAALMQPLLNLHFNEGAALPFQVGLVLLVAWMLLQRRDPARLAALAVCGFVVTGVWQPGLNVIETTRSFFGVHRVADINGGTHRLLYHGTTIHGAQHVRDADGTAIAGRPEPLTYYYFGGPISEAVAAARTAQGGLKSVAAVGLGTGSLACHRHEGESWTFFEIDPEVVRLARDPAMFSFLSNCAPAASIVLGDARLTLAGSNRQFDLIVLDAFSSDAIPTHLLTREALRGYLARLSPHGTILMHISNRHMELAKVVAAIGTAEGLVTFTKTDGKANQFVTDFHAAAIVAVLARNEADLGALPATEGWRKTDAGTVVAWTDDYSDIIGAIVRKKLEK